MQERDAALILGVTQCEACLHADAFVTENAGTRQQRHLCETCADDAIERAVALDIYPQAVELMNTARGEWARPSRLPQLDWEKADHSKLNRLRAQWLAFESTVKDLVRCWAMLADGSRCVREQEEQGVCRTHLEMGCTVPGLGWAGNQPQGRLVARRGRRELVA